jgi:RNA polymerase subunit RPABC4/transcription elongation factor Spt4
MNYEFGHINGGVLICHKCDRVWHVSDYQFKCPECGKEWEEWTSVSIVDTTQERCGQLKGMENTFTFVRSAINEQTGMKI